MMSKAEFLSVEVAQLLKNEPCSNIWYDKILFEGNVKNSNAFISLNSFVKTTRILINLLNKKGVVNLEWERKEDVNETVDILVKLIDFIWQMVYQKWNFMYSATFADRQILQGSIGYTSINRAIISVLKTKEVSSMQDVYDIIRTTILSFTINGENWKKNGVYSRYSSESGIRIIADELVKSMSINI